MRVPHVLAVTAVLLAPAPIVAQQQARQPCAAPEYRQFDFWVGSWKVFNPQGQEVGTNTIDAVLGGCALHEQWRGSGGSRGFSYNIFDRTSGRWHQTWVSNNGLLLVLEGGLVDGRMVLKGTTADSGGTVTLNRITWTPISPDSVRQHWERSSDGGTTWSVAFDGTYVRQ